MTDVLAVLDDGPTLLRELMLLEYGTCPDPVQADLLYEHRSSLQPYLDRRLLTLAFQDNKPCVRATGFVGLLPFVVGGASHLLLVAPKGCQHDQHVGLLRFLELLTFDDGASLPEDTGGWEGQLGPHPFLLFLARHYATVLRELCRRDFRSHYRGDEGDLRGRIRGRLRLGAYASLAARGRSHVLPCRWDEFTVDNWDNRILWGVARRLAQLARVLDPEAARSVWGPFGHLLSWFGSVTEVSVTSADFQRSRLGRTSRHYRDALAWARLLLQGSDVPTAAGGTPPLVLDAPKAFEKYVEAITRSALPDETWRYSFQERREFLIGQQAQPRVPDILLSGPSGQTAVGDAKYKELLGHAPGTPLVSLNEAVRVFIQPADWNQLYVNMRITKASAGFFIVPFWDTGEAPCEWLTRFAFVVPPHRDMGDIAVLGLNLLKPLTTVKQAAAARLRDWLSRMQQEAATRTAGLPL